MRWRREGGELQAFDDVDTNTCGCGGCQCSDWYGRKYERLLEPFQLLICGSEVMAPFTDAMCFVDSYSNQLALLMNSGQDFPKRLHSQKFGRNV